jgi:hypothetical protein
MADLKISALTASTTPLAGTEVLPIVQSSTTKQVSVANLTAGRAVSMISGTVGASPGAVTAPTNADDLVVQNTAAAGITILSPDANAGRIQFGTVSNNSNVTLYGQYNYGFDVVVNGSIVSHADTTTKDITVSLGNLVIGTSGKGIDFSATPGTGTSELLADYEEGTWTGAFASTTGSLTMNASFTTGTYTRVGRQVTVCGLFLASSVSSPAGILTITGLPFTSASTNRFASGGSVWAYGLNATSSPLMCKINANSTAIEIDKFVLGNATDLAGDMIANSQFTLGITYFTS